MPIIAIFLVSFAGAFLVFKRRGQKTADCIHKGLVAGILISVSVFIVATLFSYI